MLFVGGIVLFALGIAASIALHEWGHLKVAQLTGMRVRRYFIGFGPTLWSTRRQSRSAGDDSTIEYGLKAVPLGGFCDIAGMTTLDDRVTKDEEPHLMWKKPVWKRTAVLLGGPAMNFVLGFLLIYALALGWGLYNQDTSTHKNVVSVHGFGCVADRDRDNKSGQCRGDTPAQLAGVRPGDEITAVNGTPVDTGDAFIAAVKAASGPVTIDLERPLDADTSESLTVTVTPEVVQAPRSQEDRTLVDTPILGVTVATGLMPPHERYNPLNAIPATFTYIGHTLVRVAEAIVDLPGKIPPLVQSIFGGERQLDSPVSVWGASHVGGQFAERGMWDGFIELLAALNLFLGAFNLLPIPPLDGGHIAVAWYEKLRNSVLRLRGKSARGPVDYARLTPFIAAAALVLVAFGGLVIVADIVNSIPLF